MSLADLATITHDGRLVTDSQAMGHVYAAYRRGGLALPDTEPNLEPEGFGLMFGRWLMQLIGGGSQAIVIRGGREEIPIGLVIVDYNGQTAYPDIHWFPEATPRNRLEAGLYLMLELKKDHMILITVPGTGTKPTPDWKFLTHLCKYGVLRPVGTIRDLGDEHATLFQSVGN